MHSRDHADSEYVWNVGIDHKVVEFIGNKFTRGFMDSFNIQTLHFLYYYR